MLHYDAECGFLSSKKGKKVLKLRDHLGLE
jgi:hypothetical protein